MPLIIAFRIFYAFFLLFSCLYDATAASLVTPAEKTRYDACLKTNDTNPEAAFISAQDWLITSPSNAALHCKAVTAFKLKEYLTAASALQALLEKMPADATRERHVIVKQTATSLSLAGNVQDAIDVISQYVAARRTQGDRFVSRDMVDVLKQRADLYATLNALNKAIFDIDHALTFGHRYQQLLLQRAQYLLQLGLHHDALKDVNEILLIHPDNYKAIAMLEKITTSMRASE